MTLAYEPLAKVLEAATGARIEAAARALIHALALDRAQRTLSQLEHYGIIDGESAARLALELNDQLVHQSEGNGKQGAVELSAAEKPKALPAASEKPKVKRKAKVRGLDADVARFCPICLEQGTRTRLSVGSCGCVKHWREVKRRQKGGR